MTACPSCGAPTAQANQNFCFHCGRAFRPQATAQAQARPAPPTAPTAQVIHTPAPIISSMTQGDLLEWRASAFWYWVGTFVGSTGMYWMIRYAGIAMRNWDPLPTWIKANITYGIILLFLIPALLFSICGLRLRRLYTRQSLGVGNWPLTAIILSGVLVLLIITDTIGMSKTEAELTPTPTPSYRPSSRSPYSNDSSTYPSGYNSQ